MDKRTLRSRKARPRIARPYDRQNQASFFGKVCSTVKGLLNPSWLFNVSQWIGNTEDEQPGGSSDDIEEETTTVREDNDVCQSSLHGNKRLRLRFDDNVPSISSATQTMPEQPTQNLYETVSHVHSRNNTQSSLLDNKETIAVLNGDDHSENSEGSASTSGCSSLVSSHKESNRLVEGPFVNLLDFKNSRKRKHPCSKSGINELDSSRSLWSNFSPKFQRRLPSVLHTNQPSFNLSTFVGPSKMNEDMEKKVSSPFYAGRTTFGGASASRRMPPSVTLYQANRNERNKIRVREQTSEDSLEGMSSAAKRILLTLEKMSSPVADARKIPNSDASPIDLSLYLTPPKSRRNSQFTPSITRKGPPIANINTIAKLATLKNYGASRLRSSLQAPSPSNTKIEKESDSYLPKMYPFSNPIEIDNSSNMLPKDNIPVPPPCDSKTEKKSNLLPKNFVFSSPIEHDLPNNTLPKESTLLPSFGSKIEKNSDLPLLPFVFSSPIEHQLPSNNSTALPKESAPLPANTSTSIGVSPLSNWECGSLCAQSASAKKDLEVSETSKVPKETSSVLQFKGPDETKSSPAVSAVPTPSVNFSFSVPASSPAFTLGTSKSESPSISSSKPLTFSSGSKTSTWECDTCWVRNPETDSKCKACEAVRPQKENQSSKTVNSTFSSPMSSWECTSCWVRNPMKEKKCLACETLHPSADTTPGFAFKGFEKASATSGTTTSTITLVSSGGFTFGTPKTTSQDVTIGNQVRDVPPTFKFGSAVNSTFSSPVSTWECTSCWVRNPMKEKKCLACETLHPSADNIPGFAFKGFEKVSATSGSTTNTITHVSSGGFTFGTPKIISQDVTIGNKVQDVSPKFKFGSGPEKSQVSATQSVTPVVSSSSSTIEHETSKNETEKTTVTNFNFGSGAATSNNSAFQLPQSEKVTNFKFGIPTSENIVKTSSTSPCMNRETPNQTPSSGPQNSVSENIPATTNFVFGSKSDASDEIPSTVSPSSTVVSSSNFTFGVGGVATSGASTKLLPVNSTPATSASSNQKWECSACWVWNPDSSTSCAACQTPREPKEKSSDAATSNNSAFQLPQPEKVTNFKFGIPTSENIVTTSSTSPFTKKETPNQTPSSGPQNNVSENVPAATNFVFGSKSDTSDKFPSTVSQPSTSSLSSSISSSNFTFGVRGVATSGAFQFGASTKPLPINSTPATSALPSQKWECSSCWVQNPDSITSCAACEMPREPKEKSSEGLEKPQNTASVSSTATQSTTSSLNISSTVPASTRGFVFGAPKTGAQNTAVQPFPFGSGLEKPRITASASSTTTQSTTSSLNIGSTVPASTGGFVFGVPKTEAHNTAVQPFPFGSGATSTSNTSSFSVIQPTQTANPSFQFKLGSQPSGSTASASGTSSTFSFPKSENHNQIPSSVLQNAGSFGSTTTNFVFGSKSNTPNQIPSTVSQSSGLAFGSTNFTFSGKNENTSASSQNPTPTFGSTTVGSSTNFTFRGKSENTGATSQNPTPTFGSTAIQSVLGSTPVQSFGGADKPVSGGFSFGVNSAPSVFQFGASSSNTKKKRTASASGFTGNTNITFGMPTAPETNNNSFSQGFNMSTPPSFNFGATSTPAGSIRSPFAASTDSSLDSARKYKRALRRKKLC